MRERRPPQHMRRLSSFQMACLVALWGALVYLVLVRNNQIDGFLVLTIIMSAILVGLPIYRELKQRHREK